MNLTIKNIQVNYIYTCNTKEKKVYYMVYTGC